jgi:hypothetical protein
MAMRVKHVPWLVPQMQLPNNPAQTNRTRAGSSGLPTILMASVFYIIYFRRVKSGCFLHNLGARILPKSFLLCTSFACFLGNMFYFLTLDNFCQNIFLEKSIIIIYSDIYKNYLTPHILPSWRQRLRRTAWDF